MVCPNMAMVVIKACANLIGSPKAPHHGLWSPTAFAVLSPPVGCCGGFHDLAAFVLNAGGMGAVAGAAILGIPIDTASSYRFGPRLIHEMSMFHGFGPEDVFDFEDEVTYLNADEIRGVDAGDGGAKSEVDSLGNEGAETYCSTRLNQTEKELAGMTGAAMRTLSMPRGRASLRMTGAGEYRRGGLTSESHHNRASSPLAAVPPPNRGIYIHLMELGVFLRRNIPHVAERIGRDEIVRGHRSLRHISSRE